MNMNWVERFYRWTAVPLLAATLVAAPAGFVRADDDSQNEGDRSHETTTPIKHLIVIIGENHTFDNLFATYQPGSRDSIFNLLSEGIVHADGTPGPNFSRAAQMTAVDMNIYSLTPGSKVPYAALPAPNTTYATGLPLNQTDTRYHAHLPNGPFQLTNQHVPYQNAFLGDPMHRFFQMWQQYDAGALDLFPWVAMTASIGPSNDGFSPTPGHPNQGGETMGFYNMNMGDAPKFKSLADQYAISDNYHQSIMGGTGANFLAIATADEAFHTDPATLKADIPPANQIENPNSVQGLNNWYTEDGYRGGSYVNCSDAGQPGVGPIRNYLKTLPYEPFRQGNCEKGHYYLVNNYGLAYNAVGAPNPLGAAYFTLPPQTVKTMAEKLSENQISWKYYSGDRNNYNQPHNQYCSICDPFTASKTVMTGNLKGNLQDYSNFALDLQNNTLPAVSYVRPNENNAGHPANATMSGYEDFVMDLIQKVQADPDIWKDTAIMITTDEGGGYYDSGYIQPVDFFGDGTRIPMIVVSPYAKPGHVDHHYADHASISKFIERNWDLDPLSARSRDNLPNPRATRDNPYVPVNAPAISDLMGLFDFDQDHHSDN
ncbi:MAG: alkaline phosphatase family protein [Nitrospiria bacterium]